MAWLLLIHQLPPKPIYLRAKIGTRLARVGGVALKNSVYLLPDREDCLEDFQWIAEEAAAGGGSAFVWRAEVVSGITDEALQKRFNDQVTEDYELLKAEISTVLDGIRQRGSRDEGPASAPLLRLKNKFQELTGIDFFDAPARKEAETMLQTLESKLRRTHGVPTRKSTALVERSDLIGRTWITRQNPKIDRLASAWLIRRFIDPGARFRFIDPGDKRRKGEIGYDLIGGEFTHEGDRCTFETFLSRIGLSDRGLTQIAEIVHDIDLKDGKFARPEALGVGQLVEGLCQAHPRTEERLAQGFALFDNLYASFGSGPEAAPARKRKRTKRSK